MIQVFLGQHDARLLPNGNLTLFDNDYAGTSPRGVEYYLDFNTMEATKVNERIYSFNFSAASLGNFQQLDNGYGVIGWGHTVHPAPNVSLYDSNGALSTDIFFGDTVVSYRAFFQDLPNVPERPQILCQENVAGMELSVSGNHTFFKWSTGETTATITITQPGEYQCWVDYGIGSLGSYPLQITTLACPTSSISETSTSQLLPIGYYDLMGRELQKPILEGLYVVLYSDMSTELMMGN